jgi:hypothetical protein
MCKKVFHADKKMEKQSWVTSYTALQYSLVPVPGVRIDSNLQDMRMEKKWMVTKNKK